MSVTLLQIQNSVYAMLRENSGSSSAYPPSFINEKINQAQYRICAGTVVDSQGQALKKLKLPFLFKQAFYANIASIGLTVDTTLNATTLTVSSTTNYPTAGYLWIENNIVQYTGTTPTTFTWVTWVAYPFLSGARIYPVFALPADYMNTLGVQYNNSFPLEFIDENEVYQLVNSIKGRGQPWVQSGYVQNWYAIIGQRGAFYTIYQWLYLAPFYLDNSTGMFNLTYEILPTNMVADSDTTIITNDTLALAAISNLAVADVLFDRWEETRALQRLQYGIQRTRELYVFYNRQGSEDQAFKALSMPKWSGRNF